MEGLGQRGGFHHDGVHMSHTDGAASPDGAQSQVLVTLVKVIPNGDQSHGRCSHLVEMSSAAADLEENCVFMSSCAVSTNVKKSEMWPSGSYLCSAPTGIYNQRGSWDVRELSALEEGRYPPPTTPSPDYIRTRMSEVVQAGGGGGGVDRQCPLSTSVHVSRHSSVLLKTLPVDHSCEELKTTGRSTSEDHPVCRSSGSTI